MRLFIIALVLASLTMAFNVKPNYIGVQDTGNQNLDKMNVDITINCDTRGLIVKATSNATGANVPNADTFLFYTGYAYQLISTGKTGADGISNMDVSGNRSYLTALFILRVDNVDFKSKEIEFTYQKCFEPQPLPQPPAQNTTNQTNQTNLTPSSNTSASNNVTTLPNTTPPNNQTAISNVASPRANGAPTSGFRLPKIPFCPITFFLLAVAISSRRYYEN